jgi:hypothetical protein
MFEGRGKPGQGISVQMRPERSRTPLDKSLKLREESDMIEEYCFQLTFLITLKK